MYNEVRVRFCTWCAVVGAMLACHDETVVEGTDRWRERGGVKKPGRPAKP